MNLAPIIGVYLIEDIKTGRVYVGQSTDCIARLGHHMASLKTGHGSNIGLQAIYDERGRSDLHFEVVEECPADQLLYKEKAWMRRFNTEDLLNTQTPIYKTQHPWV